MRKESPSPTHTQSIKVANGTDKKLKSTELMPNSEDRKPTAQDGPELVQD